LRVSAKSQPPLRESDQNETHRPFPPPFRTNVLPRNQGRAEAFIRVSFNPNDVQDNKLNPIYLTATLDAALWGAKLALGDGREKIYLVEPTGAIEGDPNVTNKKFPDKTTMSCRSLYPFKVVGEVTRWHGHTPEQIKAMKDGLAKRKEPGLDAIEN
jgi:hypothetical protein